MVTYTVSILAIFLLKEPNNSKRWLSVFIGFIGALIIVRPGLIEFSLGVSFILTAAFMWSGFLLLGKVQGRDDPTVVVIAYSSALTVLLSLIPGLFFLISFISSSLNCSWTSHVPFQEIISTSV